MCLITQETKIQKPGHQLLVHQESWGLVLTGATGYMSISPGFVLGELPLLLPLL